MFNLFKKLNKKQSLIILVSIVFIAFQVYLDLKLPDYMQEITSLLQSSSTKIKDILILDTFFNPLQKLCIKSMVFTPKEKILRRLMIL